MNKNKIKELNLLYNKNIYNIKYDKEINDILNMIKLNNRIINTYNKYNKNNYYSININNISNSYKKNNLEKINLKEDILNIDIDNNNILEKEEIKENNIIINNNDNIKKLEKKEIIIENDGKKEKDKNKIIKENKNYVISEIIIKEEDINKDIRIINKFF